MQMKHAEINNPREFQNDECQKPKAKSEKWKAKFTI